ncbi:MAG: SRPBCC family protein [Pseudomonadota bacterium]
MDLQVAAAIVSIVAGAIALRPTYQWLVKPSVFLSTRDVSIPVDRVWEQLDDPLNWRIWMFGTWSYGTLSSRDPSIRPSVPFRWGEAETYREDIIYEPKIRISIGDDEFSITKLNDESTRIRYRHTVRHSGPWGKLWWYLTEGKLGKWSLPISRMSELVRHLESKNDLRT